jgi:peptidoglycan/xylan/chitin deacetylase (PgdA/CDA1 family)
VRLGLPVYCGGAQGHEVALTFDDGPGLYSSTVVRDLGRAGARATFFLIGEKLAGRAAAVRAERAVGAVGDHTWTHPFLTRIPNPRMLAELGDTQRALVRLAHAPLELFRPPYGFHDAAVDRAAPRLGMLEVLWSLDSHDSYPTDASTAAIVTDVERHLRPGSIVLLHEVRPSAVAGLPAILADLRRRRLRSLSVPQLLADDPPPLAALRAGIGGCPGASA